MCSCETHDCIPAIIKTQVGWFKGPTNFTVNEWNYKHRLRENEQYNTEIQKHWVFYENSTRKWKKKFM